MLSAFPQSHVFWSARTGRCRTSVSGSEDLWLRLRDNANTTQYNWVYTERYSYFWPSMCCWRGGEAWRRPWGRYTLITTFIRDLESYVVGHLECFDVKLSGSHDLQRHLTATCNTLSLVWWLQVLTREKRGEKKDGKCYVRKC